MATAISDNGQVIAGQGIDPEGNFAAWVVNLAVPEPATSILFALAGLLGAARRFHRA